jgi:enoyl-CoA hydratase
VETVSQSVGSIDLNWSQSVARIVINWPEKRNAISFAMWQSIPKLVSEINSNPQASVVVIQGAGNEAFAAGADITELESCLGSLKKGQAYMDAVETAERALASCCIPVIALIKGYCIGAGLEIAMACDLRMATDDSVFAAPPAKLGANYSFESTRRLVELIGLAKAKDLLFTGRRLDAGEAWRIGLADYVASREMIDTEVDGYVQTLISNSQYSIRVAKVIIEEIRKGAIVESERIRSYRSAGFLHADIREGVAAFRQRRKPAFGPLGGERPGTGTSEKSRE